MDTNRRSYYFINAITFYRLVSAPLLLLLAMLGEVFFFKWLIAFSFFTDAIDGPLSRRYKVTSVFGARLDSAADDATVLVSAIGLWVIHPQFVRDNWIIFSVLFGLFGIQTIAAVIVYGRVTSFHTYLAKGAAVVQGIFFIVTFFDFGLRLLLFNIASAITGLQLVEEIVLVILLPEWKTNVRGLYWVLQSEKKTKA